MEGIQVSSPELGIGIIGLGAIGVTHARALRALPGVNLVAFSGGSSQLAAESGWPGAVRLDPDAVIAHPEVAAVAVCTPTEWHAQLAIAAAEAGRHVLVEKPMATSVADAERLAALQAERGVVIAMVAQRRFEAEFAYVKSLLDAGHLGRVRLATTHVHWHRDDDYYAAAGWRSSMAAGGGSLMNQGVHNVDLLRWLCGSVADVTAQYGTLGHELDAEDTTVATLRFTSGALGMISTSTATPPGSPATLTLHTSLGVVELGQGEVIRWDLPGVPPPPADDTVISGASDPAAIGIAGHVAMWREVLDAVAGGRRSAADATDAAETVRLLCGIYEAARTGRQVRLEDLA
ncbi:Gfo/Idh/MocA family protein [Occultella kanbiaonis]|uniref:Gfo/Idh/MocA family protein n=1 Tax=Occultella kanbiaonis TaxID=2675754 RepID=UPI001F1C8DC8|nr:Gfo/Idh/MocA family oxidoreductase [Occultella kanbiaonis]